MQFNEKRKENLWDEYKYRHEHVWKLIFQLTTAIVALSVVPYLDPSGLSGIFRFIPPLISVPLVWIAYIRIGKEFNLLDPIKDEYLGKRDQVSTFRIHTRLYIFLLGAGSTAHIVLLILSQICKPLGLFLGIQI